MGAWRRGLFAALVLFSGLVLLYWFVNSRTLQFVGHIVTNVPCSSKLLALTLDDGPTLEGTDALLALFEREGAHATFFVEGQALKRFPETGRRIVAAGHELGNHSFSHSRMIFRSQSFIEQEVESTDRAILEAGFAGPIAFRPPYGKKLFGLPWYLWRTGRTTVMWNIEPESTRGVEQTPEGIAAHVFDVAAPGSILLLHAMRDPSGLELKALGLILRGLQARGYGVVSYTELVTRCAN